MAQRARRTTTQGKRRRAGTAAAPGYVVPPWNCQCMQAPPQAHEPRETGWTWLAVLWGDGRLATGEAPGRNEDGNG